MTAWHVDDVSLARWVEGSGGSVAGASVEQHLMTCAPCRARVPAPPEVPTVWARVQEELEAPPVTRLERVLQHLGLPASDARVVAVSPALRAAWLVGLLVLLAFVAAAASFGDGRGQWAFLAIAPLVPALAVALGYDPELDEAVEQECAAPYSRVRLVLLRSVALLVAAAPVLLVVSAVMPGSIAFLWLVPAAGCTALVLAASTWVPPLTAVGGVATAWVLLVGAVAWGQTPAAVLADGYLASYGLVLVGSTVLVTARRARLSELSWRRS